MLLTKDYAYAFASQISRELPGTHLRQYTFAKEGVTSNTSGLLERITGSPPIAIVPHMVLEYGQNMG